MLLRSIDNNRKLHWETSSCHYFQDNESREAFLKKFWKVERVKIIKITIIIKISKPYIQMHSEKQAFLKGCRQGIVINYFLLIHQNSESRTKTLRRIQRSELHWFTQPRKLTFQLPTCQNWGLKKSLRNTHNELYNL